VNTWKIIIATVVIYGTGVVTGGLLIHSKHRADLRSGQSPVSMAAVQPAQQSKATNRLAHAPNPVTPSFMRKEFLNSLDCEVKLSTDQRQRIEDILTDGQFCTKQLWDQVAPDVRKEWGRVKAAIRNELTPDQRERFDAMMKHRKKQDKDKDERRNGDEDRNDAPSEAVNPGQQ
jgi:hypothetical protein